MHQSKQARALEKTPKRYMRADERRAKRPHLIDPNQLYSVAEFCAASDLSRANFYVELKRGNITATKDGGRTKILGSEIIRRNRSIARGTAA